MQSGDLDIDGQSRILNGQVDIGADEYGGHDAETVTLSPEQAVIAPSTSTTVAMHVFDEATQADVEGRRVDFTVNAGEIVSISPGGHVNTPATSGWGVTGADGYVTVTLTTPTAEQKVVVTATASLPTGRATKKSVLYPAQYKVGFLYNLAHVDVRSSTDTYLTRIDQKQADVVYNRIGDISSGIDSSFNVVFVALPVQDFTQSEKSALSAFVQSGREKRVVLVGEYNSQNAEEYANYNVYLNGVATAIGMNISFSTGSNSYDNGPDRCRLCAVNPSHYLTAGVVNIWDAATDTFAAGWESYARPLAYIYSHPTWPWILEEDTTTAGSRIAIHDSSIMAGNYTDDYDMVPDKNFSFLYNLCTVFPTN